MMLGIMNSDEEWEITFELVNALTFLPPVAESGESFDVRRQKGYVGFDSVSLREVVVAPAELMDVV